jgi:hypothetical protein
MITHYCSHAANIQLAIWRILNHPTLLSNPKWARVVYKEPHPIVYTAPGAAQSTALPEIAEEIWQRWDQIMSQLEKTLPRHEYDTWIKSAATLKQADDTHWVIGMVNALGVEKFTHLALPTVRNLLPNIEISIELL